MLSADDLPLKFAQAVKRRHWSRVLTSVSSLTDAVFLGVTGFEPATSCTPSGWSEHHRAIPAS